MSRATIPYALTSDKAVGKGHPTLTDIINRPLRWVLTKSGIDPDAVFAGFLPVIHLSSYSDLVVAGDWTPALAQAALDATSGTRRRIQLPPGDTVISSSYLNTQRGVILVGERHGRPTQTGGSRICFTGTGAAIQNGTSKVVGAPLVDVSYTAGDYDGVQGLTLKNLSIVYTGSTTSALLNGLGTYGTGAFAVQDWRGGDIQMKNVTIEHFEYGFWGLQSDINDFSKVEILYCHYGLYAGPRSDQFTMDKMQFLFNDCDFWLDGCQGARFNDCQFIGSGSATMPAFKVGSQYAGQPCQQPVFDKCWFEHYQGYAAAALPYFGEIGVAPNAVSAVDDIAFLNCTVSAGLYATPPSISTMFKVGNVSRMTVENLGGMSDRIHNLIEFVGAFNPDVLWKQHGAANVSGRWTNTGTGAPTFNSYEWIAGQHMFSGNPGRLWIRQNPFSALRDFYFSCENQNQTWNVVFPNDASGNTLRFMRNRRETQAGSVPVAGNWIIGDRVLNNAPAELGSAASKYVIAGWICTASGTPGTWLQMRTLTGN